MDKQGMIKGIELVKKHIESQIGVWTSSGIPPEALLHHLLYNLDGLCQCIEDGSITEEDLTNA
jgi:hypothetical protein